MARGTLGKRFRTWQKQRADGRLFQHLCQLRELDKSDVDLLTALAERHGLVRLSEVFVRPSLFAGKPEAPSDGSRLEQLRLRLFGDALAE